MSTSIHRIVWPALLWLPILLPALEPSLCHAQTWQSLGPKTAQIVDLVATPETVYAAADQSLWKSRGTDDSWTFLRESPIVRNITLHPDRPDRIFATADNDLLRSTDGGDTWEVLTHDALVPYALDVHIDPNDPDRIWRLRWSLTEAWLSLDGGDTWDLRAVGLQHARGGRKIVPAASNPEHLYIIAYTGVFATLDEGATWQARAHISPNVLLDSLVVDPFDSQKIYVATTEGVYRSLDGGRTWILPEGPGFAADGVLRLDPDNAEVVFAGTSSGLYRSTDSAATWSRIFDQPSRAFTVQRSGSGRRLYVGDSAIYRSGDEGTTWAQMDAAPDALLAGAVNDVVIDPHNPDVLFAAFDHGDGLFRSLDGGATWEQIFGSTGTASVLSLVVVPGTETVFLGWRSTSGTTTGRGLFRSTNLGERWLTISGGDTSATQFVRHLAMHPKDADILLIANGSGVFKSIDGGLTWQATDIQSFAYFTAFDLQNPDTVFAGVYPSRLYKSLDGGLSWHMSVVSTDRNNLQSLVVSPHDSNVVLATFFGDEQPSIRSTDGGSTWTDMPSSAPWQDVAFDPDRAGRVYAVSSTGALQISHDAGASWQVLDPGPGYPGRSVTLDPIDSHVVYVGTRGGSVYKLDLLDAVQCPRDSRKALCLGSERFKVEARWHNGLGGFGSSQSIASQSSDSGLFWFFSPLNYELMVKVLDGCAINDHHWVFGAATTDIAYSLFVTDMVTGERVDYRNPAGISAPSIADTAAFAGCF